MPYELTDKVAVGMSSRTLFDLEKENQIFENEHLEAYIRYQLEHEDDLLKPGTAFPMVKAMLAANTAWSGCRAGQGCPCRYWLAILSLITFSTPGRQGC